MCKGVIQVFLNYWKNLNARQLLLWAALYVVFYVLLDRLAVTSAQYDFAEQLIWSQEVLIGYGHQPPLYTWLMAAVFGMTEYGLTAVFAVKFVLLFGILFAVWSAGRILQLSSKSLSLAVLGFALLPSYILFSFKGLTHTVMVTFFAACALWQVLAIVHYVSENTPWWRYILLGVLVGLGILSKYNMVVFALALLVALCAVSDYRKRVHWLGVLLAVGVAVAVVLPHLLWFVDNYQASVETVRDEGVATALITEAKWVVFLKQVFGQMLRFLLPFGLLAAVQWNKARAFRRKHQAVSAQNTGESSTVQRNASRFFCWLFFCGMLVTLLFLLAIDIYSIRGRWMLPIWFFVPLWLAVYVQGQRAESREQRAESAHVPRSKWYVGVALLVAVFALQQSPMRAARVAMGDKEPKRHQMPYAEMAQVLHAEVEQCPTMVVSVSSETNDEVTLGGNLKRFFDCSAVYPASMSQSQRWKNSDSGSASVLVVCSGRGCVEKLASWRRNHANAIQGRSLDAGATAVAYAFQSKKTVDLQWLYITKQVRYQ